VADKSGPRVIDYFPVGELPIYGNGMKKTRVFSKGDDLIIEDKLGVFLKRGQSNPLEMLTFPPNDSASANSWGNPFAASSERILFTTGSKMLQSLDNGKTWNPMPKELDSVYSIHSFEEFNGRLVLRVKKTRTIWDSSEVLLDTVLTNILERGSNFYNCGLISSDAGKTWTLFADDYANADFSSGFNCGAFISGKDVFFQKSEMPGDNVISSYVRSQDSGRSWSPYTGSGIPIPKSVVAMLEAYSGMDEIESEESKAQSLMSVLAQNTVSEICFAKAQGFYRAPEGIFYVSNGGLFFSTDEAETWKEAGNSALRQQIDAVAITNDEILVWSRLKVWKASLKDLKKALSN
jgi:hypothetical protein